jgi:hypothetical protein
MIPVKQKRLNAEKRLISVRHAGFKDPAPHHDAGSIQCRNAIKKLDSPSTSLRVVSLSNHGSSPE